MLRIAVVTVLLAAALLATDLRERAGRALYHAGLPGVAAIVMSGPAWKGAALYHGGRYDEAAAAFRSADYAGQPYDLGTTLARGGRLREAAEALDLALDRDPNDEDARFNLALVEAMMRTSRAVGPDAKNAANAAATENKRSNSASPDAENDVNSLGPGAAGDRDTGKEAQNAGPSKVTRTGRAEQSDRPMQSGKATGSIGSAEGAGRTGDAERNVSKPPEQLAHRLAPMALKTMAASQRWLETLPDDPGVYIRRRIEHERDARKERGVAAPTMTDTW
ncbi:tetratricopeptide repeat protein [Hansschlegelia zhihuaiae]|uniref:Tetratricopeptide repeat protein n=1 Tax=Hansschlegelia zhihuaiae TaxID=405005 RepID=A0A4Q0MBV7_9HYPH|nr:tetratricopeptide repeat protein [Hansschlegelia zhihuaiae]RXF70801.1 tetratricopeptide repeat protein [Hansschlegelia zhihuaiae]